MLSLASCAENESVYVSLCTHLLSLSLNSPLWISLFKVPTRSETASCTEHC